MSVQNEIDRITTNIADAYYAVENKGGTLPAALTSDNLADAIQSISGGESYWYDKQLLNFYDFTDSRGYERHNVAILNPQYEATQYIGRTNIPANIGDKIQFSMSVHNSSKVQGLANFKLYINNVLDTQNSLLINAGQTITENFTITVDTTHFMILVDADGFIQIFT